MLIVLFAWVSSVCASPSVIVAGPELPDLVERILPGVVNISSTHIINYNVYGMDDFLRFWGLPQEHKQTSLGTGFIIDTNGFVITNHHVIEGADEVLVTLVDKRQFTAKIVGKDPKLDLALLQLRDDDRKVPPNLKPATLGNSDAVRIAEPVFAVGNPFGLQHTVTMGIISAKNRTIGLGPFDNFLQTDASINPGNSGGPLFNLKGEVVGINTVIYSRTGQSGGLGFAIPTNEAKKILPDLHRYGRVPRPWLGVLTQKLNPQIARALGLKKDQEGILVLNTVQGAPADRVGLERGDVIVSVEATPLKEPNDLDRVLSSKRPKDSFSLKVLREGRPRTIELKLEELPRRIEKLPQGVL
jgi:serine protease Do